MCAKYLLPLIPRHEHYYEIFSGQGAVLFRKEPSAHETLNDLDEDLITTLTVIRDDPEALISSLAELPLTREQFNYLAREFEPVTPLERAMRWYYVVRMCYSCMVGRPVYRGDEGNHMDMIHWWPRIRAASGRLADVELTCSDFEAAIAGAPAGSFLFLDPPYVDVRPVYRHNFEAPDHERLAAVLKRHFDRVRFLLVYNDHPAVLELYRSWTTIRRLGLRYTFGPSNFRFPKLLLARNYPAPRFSRRKGPKPRRRPTGRR